jgi:hypothetical protein
MYLDLAGPRIGQILIDDSKLSDSD